MNGVVAALLVIASIVVIVAEAMRSPSSPFLHRSGDYLLFAAALSSIGTATGRRGKSEDRSSRSRVWGGVAGAGAAVPVIATLAHHRGFEIYPLVVAVVIGASTAALVARERAASADVPAPFPMVLWLFLPAITLAGRHLAPGSILQSFVLAPLFVLLLPGLALGYALLPAAAGRWERLFWAPVLSLGTYIVSLLWLDWLGVTAWVTLFVVIAVYFTGLGLSAAPRFRSRSGPLSRPRRAPPRHPFPAWGYRPRSPR
jgi:hypothetical protein